MSQKMDDLSTGAKVIDIRSKVKPARSVTPDQERRLLALYSTLKMALAFCHSNRQIAFEKLLTCVMIMARKKFGYIIASEIITQALVDFERITSREGA